MGRSAALLVIVATLLVSACERQAAQDTTPAIVPGGGIGPIRIGMVMRDATRVLGPPKNTRGGAGGEMFYAWFDTADNTAHGLYVVALADHVIRVGVHYDPQYATPVGLRVGANEGQVTSAMGDPSRIVSYGPSAHGLVYNNVGIGFTIIDAANVRGYQTVAEIDVFGPQQWKWGRTQEGDRAAWTRRKGCVLTFAIRPGSVQNCVLALSQLCFVLIPSSTLATSSPWSVASSRVS